MADEVLDYEEDDLQETPVAQGEPRGPPGISKGTPQTATTTGVMGTDFSQFFLKPELSKAVHEAGFHVPSDVQLQCIPHAILGSDILCQAKSGTGKTGVFIISTLQELDENAIADAGKPAILVLAPTRELAYQIASQYQRFKKYMSGVRLGLFFGGLSFGADVEKLKKGFVHIVVGTPGRVLALVKANALDLSAIRHFIVDECDKMLSQLDMRKDVQEIFMAASPIKQVLMFTATLPGDIQEICRKYMKNPHEVIVEDESSLVLQRLVQHYLDVVPAEKTETLIELQQMLEYDQIIVFVNTVQSCGILGDLLNEQALDNITIHSAMTQDERLARYNQFKNYKARILIATDLFGRGMDITAVNIVINYDCPRDTSTYLHRIARAGRFDKKGLAITFVSTMQDKLMLEEFQERYDVVIPKLPDELEFELYNNHPQGEEPEKNME